MKEKNYKALRKNNYMNMKMGRRMKGKNSFKKDKMNMKWNEGQDETDYYTNTTEIVGSVRPGTLYYKYVRNYFKFNLRRESEVVKKQCSYSFECHIADFYEELKKMCSLFFLVVVFEVGGGSCFFC